MASSLASTIGDINAYLAQGTLLPTDRAWYEGAAN